MKKQASKKVVLYSEETEKVQRKRVAFRDYSKDKKSFELTVEWIFLPVRFKSYGFLLSDGNEEYRINLNVNPKKAETVLDIFDFKIGKDREGKILVVRKRDKEISIEEGEEEAKYIWISGKGWRLVFEEKDDIPF